MNCVTSCKKWGMKVNPDKCDIISADADNIQINGNIAEKSWEIHLSLFSDYGILILYKKKNWLSFLSICST